MAQNRLDTLFDSLELYIDRGLYFYEQEIWRENGFSFRVKKAIDAIKPYAFYSINDDPLILFFTNEDGRDIKSIHNQAWNFQAPVVIIDNDNEWQIFNGFSLSNNKEFLQKLAASTEISDFSFWNLQSGKTWDKYSSNFKSKKLDTYLLENISVAIDLLVQEGLDKTNANSLIGRLIFSRYLIDRGVELEEQFITKGDERKSLLDIIITPEKLFSFFAYLKDEFGGHLFPITENEKENFNEKHSKVLFNLFSGNNLSSGQISLFDIYDFNIIPIELISNIYERFIGKDQRTSSQSIYTPAFLVDYILKNTVEVFLRTKKTCKVLDPSCGSGIFLVETLRKLIENNLGQDQEISDASLTELVTNNIFGIDKDANAINIAIFSLYLTLLDYKHPKDIRNFKFPALVDTNFFELNFFAPELIEKFKNIKLDFIIGNPPWKSVSDDDIHLAFAKKHLGIISDFQIAQSFIINLKNFVVCNTKCALVMTSKVLYNLNASNFRRFLLENFKINSVLELSSVRKLIFKEAIGPCAILFLENTDSKEACLSNIIHHISLKHNRHFDLFRSIVIEKFDYKKVVQKYFYDNDWLWKVLVYGNILDFFFIKRLKRDYITINDAIKDYNLSAKQGVQIGGGDHNDASHLVGLPFVDTSASKKQLRRFHVDFKSAEEWNTTIVHRARKAEVFTPPAVLIKKGLTTHFELVSAFSDQKCVFTDSITSIRGADNQVDILLSLEGCMNSKLFPYFTLMTGSSAGIEREQAHNEDEKFKLPLVISPEISKVVKELESIQSEISNELLEDISSSRKFRIAEYKFNQILFDLYDLSDEEKDLIGYSHDVSIPQFRGERYPYLPLRNMREIKTYTDVFFDYFSQRYNSEGEFFKIDVVFEKYFLAVHFRIVNEKPIEVTTDETKNSKTPFFSLLQKLLLRPQKITDDLFLQKDLKGFEPDSFYVIKPNERKNWHPAIARLDMMEFVDAILKNNKPSTVSK